MGDRFYMQRDNSYFGNHRGPSKNGKPNKPTYYLLLEKNKPREGIKNKSEKTPEEISKLIKTLLNKVKTTNIDIF